MLGVYGGKTSHTAFGVAHIVEFVCLDITRVALLDWLATVVAYKTLSVEFVVFVK